MNVLDWLNLIVIVLLGIWSIYQTRLAKRLDEQIHRLSVELDQSIQLLYRAREDVIKIHSIHLYLLSYGVSGKDTDDVFNLKLSEMSAYDAELRGLAIAIDDKDLLALVNESYDFYNKPLKDRAFFEDEVKIRSRSQRLHTQISKLLQNSTKE